MHNPLGEVILGPHIDPCGGCGHALPSVDVARRFAEAMLTLFEEAGVAPSPLIMLRVDDVLSSYLVARRLEEALWQADAEETETGRGRAASFAAAAEPLAKARERLRKAMKELEDLCTKAGTPIDAGLAAHVAPLLEKTRGVLEAALRREQENRRQAPPTGPHAR